MEETKPFKISKYKVKEAFNRVKANKGTYGIDDQTIEEYEQNLKDNLYKLWNRMSSGTYFPKPVKAVAIPKKNGGQRILGIPTVEDRVAQMVAKLYLEPKVEPIFYDDSYGYRPNKSAIDAIEVTRKRCWKYEWVLEFDIKGLFDNIRHDYLLKLVSRHTEEKWIMLYIERWLKTPFQKSDGTIEKRTAGTPQGGVISPVLANIFMHYVFDDFMSKQFKTIPWCRYADDGVCHCVSLKQAKYLKRKLQERFAICGIEMNVDKTRIVYCKETDRTNGYENVKFDFLGYTFRPRSVKTGDGRMITGYLPAISEKAKKTIRTEIRSWNLQKQISLSIKEIAEKYNSKIRGWINYYSHFYKSEVKRLLKYINKCIIKWIMRKYKKATSKSKARKWLQRIAENNTEMFAHWKFGVMPKAMIMGAV